MAYKTITYREAIIEAQRAEMLDDPSVVLLGEDIGPAGGVFKTTEGLFEQFGKNRVLDTPIAETGFVGAALGMAVAGYRPVVEIMFADFIGVCFDQIVNSIAKHRFMSGGTMTSPLVIRTACGGGVQFGAQHSQTAESWLFSVPGLKIYVPSGAADAYSLLRRAIRDPNPVIVLEHKGLLASKEDVEFDIDAGSVDEEPRVLRSGNDVTIVASLAMVREAVSAAEILAQRGVSAEVIDIRALRPLNTARINASVQKTNFLVTVEEQARIGGWGGEVVADVTATSFDYLDVPPLRLAMEDHPLPFSKPLESAARPSAEMIARQIMDAR